MPNDTDEFISGQSITSVIENNLVTSITIESYNSGKTMSLMNKSEKERMLINLEEQAEMNFLPFSYISQ
jgi:hypothetical protein